MTDLCFQTKFEDGPGHWDKVFHPAVEKPDNQGGGGDMISIFILIIMIIFSSTEAALADVDTGGDFE